ncbi:BON domain-containing protein [Hymenobacter siberiensis]|uniref:BON domain-containing protein n=1 Tax=Hymenobacter siberiensis TaxID=2848396 RepID=UPI001C1E1FCC|nr:BON domain-containing protein [Hymenobacter siberiensis]MBU6120668.1 BON domain-containing protein [Hymenobacter siberiensis]
MQSTQLLTPPAATERVTDAAITAAIKMLLANKKGLVVHQIAVQTRDGIVELSGFTTNLLARQRAEEIALAVHGVGGVHSTLVVRTADVPDAELQHAVARALADDPATNDYQVHCRASHCVVTLSGLVQSWAEKQLVLCVVQGVRGVRGVEAGELMIRGGAILNSDEEIVAQIREQLDWDIRVNGALVVVSIHEQVVHLSGTVGTAAEKDRIVGMAYQTGTTCVDARDLFVAYWVMGREIRREKFAPKTDAAIGAAVRAMLHFNPRVRSAETLVQVLDGVVTLAGTVRNLRIRQGAEQDARHVVGVHNVHNLLKVRPAQLVPDEEIRQTIVAALARDPYVGHLQFGVQVHGGQALLTGRVDTHFELEQAGDVVAGANGVVDVNNRLDVVGAAVGRVSAPAPRNPDLALAARIRARYRWSAGLHDQEVAVQVVAGRATLTGTVDTWLDRKLAAQEAHEAGAHEVNNHLLVLNTDPRINRQTPVEYGIEA